MYSAARYYRNVTVAGVSAVQSRAFRIGVGAVGVCFEGVLVSQIIARVVARRVVRRGGHRVCEAPWKEGRNIHRRIGANECAVIRKCA